MSERALPVVPKVKLISAIASPFDLSVASARTCYSSKGIIWPEEVSADEKSVALRNRIAESTREAGHLTTRQHAHFVFALSDVSRHCIWSFLHSHPYYNSEQVSQRYVKVRGGRYFVPPLKERARQQYDRVVSLELAAYEKLIALILPRARGEYYRIFPARERDEKRWESVISKRAYEVARYVLPIATSAYLYHTISALTLIRYYKYCRQFDTPLEQRLLVEAMVREVLKVDPEFARDLEEPILFEEHAESLYFKKIDLQESRTFIREFDHSLEGRISKLVSHTPDPERMIGDAVRVVLGRGEGTLSDSEAVERVLNPKKNPSLGDVLGAGTLSKLGRALHLVHFVFKKKLSHTADSQDQRHRATPAARPLLMAHYSGEPDYIVPQLIAAVPEAADFYAEQMNEIFKGINQLIEEGVEWEVAQYLLPNAFPVRFIETGDLLGLHHKWKLRTCYNAQEEIFAASVDELSQAALLFPALGEYLRAPCYVRKLAGEKPFCPEKERFCGLPVWNYAIEDYLRII
ncbi:MAG: FAD-dependent thymidylate synthase [Deltaproteobacteria bacterium]|nr:FAD-dependent thymidylate synthase [Deltaproteobacteria bacterium]